MKTKMVALRVDIPEELDNRLNSLVEGKWGEKSRLVRNGLKIAIEMAERERRILEEVRREEGGE